MAPQLRQELLILQGYGDSKDVVIVGAHFKNAFRGADQNRHPLMTWQLSDEAQGCVEDMSTTR
jgi:hypothetical protein